MVTKRANRNEGLGKNQGFSLVEVLVCIAILAIFCIPLFSGFRSTALMNNKAHHIQGATAYAQKTMEAIKSMQIDVDNLGALETQLAELLEDSEGKDVTVWDDLDTDLRNEFDSNHASYAGDEKYDSLFKIVYYQQEEINIGGRKYDMNVSLNPIPYSNVKADTAEELTQADDANVYALTRIDDVDGMKYPVIAGEIERYEAGSAILNTMMEKAEAIDKQGVFEEGLLTIYQNLTKEIIVTINPSGTGVGMDGRNYDMIQVVCEVDYQVDYKGCKLDQSYNVYTGNFVLACGEVCATSTPQNHKKFSEWEQGGEVYIFAKAYKDQSVDYLGAHIKSNGISIRNNYAGRHPLDIYLVRGQYADGGDNFHFVNVNGTPYYSGISLADNLTGEVSYGTTTNFHTNIKGMLTGISLSSTDKAQTIGKEEPRLRNYEVTVTLTEKDSNKVAAHIVSTKKVK